MFDNVWEGRQKICKIPMFCKNAGCLEVRIVVMYCQLFGSVSVLLLSQEKEAKIGKDLWPERLLACGDAIIFLIFSVSIAVYIIKFLPHVHFEITLLKCILSPIKVSITTILFFTIFLFVFTKFYCFFFVCVCMRTHIVLHSWKSEDNLRGSAHSFCPMVISQELNLG